MHQIKLFVGLESDLSSLQMEVNAWLKESNAKVHNIFGNIAPQTTAKESGGSSMGSTGRRFSPSDIFLAIVFEEE